MSRVLVLAAVFVATAAQATTQVHYVMGTFLRVVVDDDVDLSTFDGCFAEARALDRMFSRFDPASELVRLNDAGGGLASEPFRNVLGQALALGAATGGAFDVSVGAATALWRTAAGVPDARAVSVARASVGRVAVEGERVALGSGTRLDFDGFAKGVAVDACVTALRRAGVTRALVSFGESSLYGVGAPRGADAWTIEVRGPDPGVVVARLRLLDRGLAMSSVFGGAGSRAHARGHVVDPASGRPLRDDVTSVVVAPRAADAEAWAKAVLVRGPEGVEFGERADGIQAARLGRDHAAIGRVMRAAGILRVLADRRPLDGEAELR